jgi:hypothetical protein
MSIVPGLDGLRIPARLGTVVLLGLAVLGSLGAARLFSRTEPAGWRLPLATLLGLLVLAEGYGGPVPLASWDLHGRSEDQDAYMWLAEGPDGAVLELPIMEENRAQQSNAAFSLDHVYQYGNLLHDKPLINGGADRAPALTRFLSGSASPLREPGSIPSLLDMLRSLGVRYVVVHQHDYVREDEAERIIQEIGGSGRIEECRTFQSTVACRLVPGTTAGAADVSGLVRVPTVPSAISASQAHDRIERLADGDADSRWISGSRQTGGEWIEIDLPRPTNVRLLRLTMAERSLGDYPRALSIESIGPDGARQLMFEGSVLPQFAAGIVADGARPAIDLRLDDNSSVKLRLRQTGLTRTFNWSIHELEIWE